MNRFSKTAHVARSTCDQYKLALGKLELNHGILKSDYDELKAHCNELDDELRDVLNENTQLSSELLNCQHNQRIELVWVVFLCTMLGLIIGYSISGFILI